MMTEMLKQYVGKDCIVYTINGQVSGTVAELGEGWLMVDNGKDIEAVNLEYVTRVREYPRNKKGKRAALVVD